MKLKNFTMKSVTLYPLILLTSCLVSCGGIPDEGQDRAIALVKQLYLERVPGMKIQDCQVVLDDTQYELSPAEVANGYEGRWYVHVRCMKMDKPGEDWYMGNVRMVIRKKHGEYELERY